MSWQELLKRGKEQYEAGKYREARATISDTLAQASKESATALEIAEIKLELGKTCRLVTAYDESINLLNEAADVFKNEGKEALQALALNFLGLLYQSLHQLDDSQRVLDEALEIAQRVFKNKHEDFGEVLNSHGLLAWRRGDDIKSLEYYNRALEIYRATVGEDNDRFAESIDNIGVAYQRLGDLEKSVEHHKRSIEIRERCIGRNHPNVGYGLINLASAKSRLGDEKDYEQLVKRTIAIFEEGFGPENPDTSLAINNLGSYYLEKMRLDDALEIYNDVLKRRESVFGPDHPQLRLTYHNLATVHKLLGHAEEAKHYADKSRVLLRKAAEEEGGKKIETMITLADSLQSNNEKEEAQQILLDALATVEDGPEKNDSKAARVLEMLGAMNVMTSHETAKEYFFKLLKIQKNLFGAKHPNTSKTLRSLANCFTMQGDTTTAQVLQAQARAIEFKNEMDNPDEQVFSAFLGRRSKDGEDSGISNRLMITMLRMQGKDDEADEMEKEQLELRAAILGADSLEYAEELRTMALGQMDDVYRLGMLEKVLAIQEAHSDVDVDDLLWTLQAMVISCSSIKNYEKAEQLLLKGLAIEQKRKGADHWTLKNFFRQLGLNAEQQQNSEAQERYKKQLEAIREPTEEEEEEHAREHAVKVQKRMNKAMEGLGSMFQGLTDSLSALGGMAGDATSEEQEASQQADSL